VTKNQYQSNINQGTLPFAVFLPPIESYSESEWQEILKLAKKLEEEGYDNGTE
jgi:hypothetical protein